MKIHPLRFQRFKRGWSQYHLAFLTGVPQVKISYAERGYPALTTEQQKRIAEIFGSPREKLFPDKEAELEQTSKDGAGSLTRWSTRPISNL